LGDISSILNQLAGLKQEYDNSPVYVVPDQPVKYGEEVPRQNWQQTLDSLVKSIQSYRSQNPINLPFKPGTPTLSKQQFDWLKQYQEAQLTGVYKGNPTIETLSSWAKKSEDNTPPTATERKLKAEADLYNTAVESYKDFAKKYDYPLYETLKKILRDKEHMTASLKGDVDLRKVIDAVIRTVSWKTPEEYFSTVMGSKLKPFYDALPSEENGATFFTQSIIPSQATKKAKNSGG